jgi:pyridine nucleotide-disulfide oxidoreductase family protein
MRRHKTPAARDLVLVGGGHSHALALRRLGMRPLPGVRITLVSDVASAAYSGMLPGHVGGFYSWDEMHIDLRRLCTYAGVRFVLGCVEGVDLEQRRVRVNDRPPLRADVVSINVGSTPRTTDVPGAEAWTIPSKPVARLLAGWERVQAAAAQGHKPRVVLVGAGAGGVELAITMHRQLGSQAAFTVLHQGPHILPGHNSRVRTIYARLLRERGLEVRANVRAVEVTDSGVRTQDGNVVPAEFVFWVTHAAPPRWLADSGLAVDASGFLRVGPTLQSLSHPWVFGVGDVASIERQPRPKSGVFAVRMAGPLLANLRALLANAPLRAYRPQRHVLSLIGTGDGKAVASRRWLAGRSALFWKWKDLIDRRFMAQFTDLPAMPDAPSGGLEPAGSADALSDL